MSKSNSDRRGFLKTGFLGLVAGVFAKKATAASPPPIPHPEPTIPKTKPVGEDVVRTEVCNYTDWRRTELTRRNGTRSISFDHVPGNVPDKRDRSGPKARVHDYEPGRRILCHRRSSRV